MRRFCLLSICNFLLIGAFAAGQAKYKVLYSFGTNPNDGSAPNGGLVFDGAGNIYGTTPLGGSVCSSECGTVFELSPSGNGTWTETVVYDFCQQTACADGANPGAGLIIDSGGNLYGTTVLGGMHGAGTVFELSPPSVPGDNWQETVLWSFGGPGDGGAPYSKLTLDSLGNLYGTTSESDSGRGAVFELSLSLNGWTERVLYNFCHEYPDCSDGDDPMAGVTFDQFGNAYGTTVLGGGRKGNGWGVVYELAPAGSNWTETTLYNFTLKSGGKPLSEVNFDHAGNLYGTVSWAGKYGCGGLFRMTPGQDGWAESILPFDSADGCSPQAGVFVNNIKGAVYGTTQTGGAFGGGTAFQRTVSKLTTLYSFCSQSSCQDGSLPASFLTPAAGSLYGTTSQGGTSSACGELGCGVVFEIAP
jgi:uncharacterized repeat protein (TIGR03803 family)